MAGRIGRDEALYLLVYLTAFADFKEGGWFGIGEGEIITEDENNYLEVVKTKENLKIDEDIVQNPYSHFVSVNNEHIEVGGVRKNSGVGAVKY